MKTDLREICELEISRIKARQAEGELSDSDVNKLQKLMTSLKTLEDSKTPETDKLASFLEARSNEDLFEILDSLEEG